MDLSSLLRYNGMTLEIVIWSLFIGIVIGILVTLYIKYVPGRFVRRLLELDAFSPESAKTLKEAGCDRSLFLLGSLRAKGSLRRVVSCCGPAEGESGKTRKLGQLKNAGWYISSEMRARAESLYGSKGNLLLISLLAVLGFFIAALLSFTVIPDLVTMASNAFGSFGA